MLYISSLHKYYADGTHALKGIDLKVEKGEFVILLGLSGSGKSTLLRCINRLIEPSSGEIVFDDKHVEKASSKELREIRHRIGMIFQQFNLVRNLSVMTNVLTGRLGSMNGFGSLTLPWKRDEIARARVALERVGLTDFASRQVRNLSGGQQQRVAIARALMQEPQLILADEPVASLDPATADTVMRYLGELNRKDSITVVCSLHFLSLARKYGSRVVALKDGKVVYDGAPSTVDNERFREIYGEDAEEVEIR